MADTSAELNVGSLPPTQSLILDVLAARARLGEPAWNFPARNRLALDALQDRGLIAWKHWTLPGTCLAWLTDKGRDAVLSATYTPPDGYTFTRDALVDALARIELRVALTGPVAGMILADSMADAIIEAMGYGAGNPVAGTREDGERD